MKKEKKGFLNENDGKCDVWKMILEVKITKKCLLSLIDCC
jgi:hypothetical protein